MQELKPPVRIDGGSTTTPGTRHAISGQGPSAVEKMWPPAPQSVGRARKFLVRHLDAWELPQLADSAELILSELVTNALAHAHPPYGNLIATRLQRLDHGVRIEVHDANGSKPELRRDPDPDAVSGRGLALVDTLTEGHWGVSDREGPGKVVWAVVR